MLDAEPDHGCQIGDDQDDVLGHLGPGHRLHAAEHRAHQNAAEADEYADAELQAGEAAGDQANAVDLRHHVDEGADDCGDDADGAHDVAAVARAEEVGDRELAELAQVGREEQRHQAVTTGPAHDKRQPVITGKEQRAGHADEGGRAHPVRAGGHAVEEGWHTASRDVILGHLCGAAHDADAGIQADGRGEEHVADPGLGQAHLFRNGKQNKEQQEAADIPAVGFFQLAVERRLRKGAGAHSSSPSATSYSLSSPAMYLA